MKLFLILSVSLSLWLLSISVGFGEPAPLVVIKADDLRYYPKDGIFGSGWNRFLDYTGQMNIPISAGIICETLEKGDNDYFEAIKALQESGRVEFWNHGYYHKRDKETGMCEFRGPDFEAQLDNLSRSQALAREKLGFDFHAFGAPYNAVDENTVKALRELPEIQCWLYGKKNAELLPGQIVLTRNLNIEQPVHHPNYEAFVADFNRRPDEPYYVLQVHPKGWDETGFEEFTHIIDFLRENGAVFLTPAQLRTRLEG